MLLSKLQADIAYSYRQLLEAQLTRKNGWFLWRNCLHCAKNSGPGYYILTRIQICPRLTRQAIGQHFFSRVLAVKTSHPGSASGMDQPFSKIDSWSQRQIKTSESPKINLHRPRWRNNQIWNFNRFSMPTPRSERKTRPSTASVKQRTSSGRVCRTWTQLLRKTTQDLEKKLGSSPPDFRGHPHWGCQEQRRLVIWFASVLNQQVQMGVQGYPNWSPVSVSENGGFRKWWSTIIFWDSAHFVDKPRCSLQGSGTLKYKVLRFWESPKMRSCYSPEEWSKDCPFLARRSRRKRASLTVEQGLSRRSPWFQNG